MKCFQQYIKDIYEKVWANSKKQSGLSQWSRHSLQLSELEATLVSTSS